MKKNRLLIASLLLLIISVVVFYLVIPIRKAPKKENLTPTKQTNNLLLKPIDFKDLRIEYRQENKLVIVFYRYTTNEAVEQFGEFLEQQNLKLEDVKVEYIKLERDQKEPPPGYGQ